MTLTAENPAWRTALQLALPKEHGSWSLALEPVAFGLLVAPSKAGAALALAAGAGFFLRRPLKLALAAKVDARQPLARVCVTVLAIAALSGLALALGSGAPGGGWPLVPAAAAAAVFAWCDGHNGARESTAELAGAVAFGLLPAAFGALAGWGGAAACALGIAMLARSLPTVLTVRTYLRRRKGQAFCLTPGLVAVGAGLGLTVWLGKLGLVPWATAAFALVFAGRTFWLLLTPPRLAVKTIGISEAVLGVMMVFILTLTWKRSAGW